MLIRFAKESDLPRVNELRRQVNDLHVAGEPTIFRPGFNEELQKHLWEIFFSEECAVLVAEDEDGVVGFACLKFVERTESAYRNALRYLDVDEFGVDECHRRQGIGRALFDRIRELARERGCKRIELNMWAFNEGALKFYEAIGFRTYRRYMEYTLDQQAKRYKRTC